MAEPRLPAPADALTEWLAPDWGFSIRSAKRREAFHSGLQAIEVHDSESFGTLLRLDGHFMTSEKDEFFYHENLVHMAAITHDAPRRVLIIGGGDGGSAEELLKHPGIERVTLVEIDPAVVDVARRHLQGVHRGSLDDPRLTLKIEDGFAYVQASAEPFDLIVLDLTDPGGPSTLLYTPEFYRACAARLGEGGIMTLHIASPLASPQRIRETLLGLRQAFGNVIPYLTSVPLYGGLWLMALCSQQADPRRLSAESVDARLQERGIHDLQYYNGAMHCAALALPNFVRALLP
ncbi:MAG: polyamine aminopropyltransferase [Azonexus sp.]|jgi:spermidine synthase|uniref:polyamine aminopropyltransferase n=1 Tax=Azonexus sp. TaxID=1872668 RepID=UPI00281FB493|nr:polyamine aminopropyltransferase [Azonexus sp.]MDR0777288.1 polyamine aminopropyltransferase [Azonexus sp.]